MNHCSQQHSQEVSTISSYKEGSSEKGRDRLKVTEIGVKSHSKLHVLSPCSPLSATATNGPPRPDCASSPSSPKATLYPPTQDISSDSQCPGEGWPWGQCSPAPQPSSSGPAWPQGPCSPSCNARWFCSGHRLVCPGVEAALPEPNHLPALPFFSSHDASTPGQPFHGGTEKVRPEAPETRARGSWEAVSLKAERSFSLHPGNQESWLQTANTPQAELGFRQAFQRTGC